MIRPVPNLFQLPHKDIGRNDGVRLMRGQTLTEKGRVSAGQERHGRDLNSLFYESYPTAKNTSVVKPTVRSCQRHTKLLCITFTMGINLYWLAAAMHYLLLENLPAMTCFGFAVTLVPQAESIPPRNNRNNA